VGAWLEDNIKWAKAPKEYNPKLRVGRTSVLYFAADHSFALIYATVNRVTGEYEVISNGDGQDVYLGTWSISENSIALTYRLVSRTVLKLGEKLPGPRQQESAEQIGTAIVLLGHSFHRSSALDKSAREFAVQR
jgi:hypothetical protein